MFKQEKCFKKKKYENFHETFQDVQFANTPWAKLLAISHGVVNQVCCRVCTTIEGNERFLVAKLDSVYKYARRKKAKENYLGMAKGTIKYCKKIMHQKNETLYATSLHNNVVHQLDLGEIGKNKKKRV